MVGCSPTGMGLTRSINSHRCHCPRADKGELSRRDTTNNGLMGQISFWGYTVVELESVLQ
jgi:hypothetical protein